MVRRDQGREIRLGNLSPETHPSASLSPSATAGNSGNEIVHGIFHTGALFSTLLPFFYRHKLGDYESFFHN